MCFRDRTTSDQPFYHASLVVIVRYLWDFRALSTFLSEHRRSPTMAPNEHLDGYNPTHRRITFVGA
jgi:hypothetical protein